MAFVWIPTYGSRLTVKPSVHQLKYGDGYELRVRTGINVLPRRWDLTFENRPEAVADQIEAFLEAREGAESFDWTPSHGKPGKWVCREWSSMPTSHKHRTITATFEEVFEA